MSGSKRCQAIGACWRVTGCLPRGMAMSKVTVLQWRTRYSELGMTGLDDLARSGRPRRIDHLKIVAASLKETFKFSPDPDLVAKVTDVVGVIDGARTGPSPRGPHPP